MHTDEITVKLVVRRFHPGRDQAPWTATYDIRARPRDTLFDGLYAAQGQDPTLALRGTCRSAVCGGCAMNVNGRPRLACQVLLEDAAAEAKGGPIRLEPLPHFRVLKDLVVDIDPFLATLQAAQAWLLPRANHDGKVAPDVSKLAEPAATCVLCGICDSALHDLPEGSPSPAALVKSYRFAADPRDVLGPARLQVIGDMGLLPSAFAERLEAVCPKGIRLELDRLRREIGRESDGHSPQAHGDWRY